MGWKSDWLYRLIFQEVRVLWQKAHREGTGKYGPAPRRIYVEERTGYDPNTSFTTGSIIRLWEFNGGEFIIIPEGKGIIYNQNISGMFYEHGRVDFHISQDRKYVFWGTCLGPRYGEGKAYRVIGQGRTARLEREEKFGSWIS